MRATITCLIAIGAIAGLAVHKPPWPAAARATAYAPVKVQALIHIRVPKQEEGLGTRVLSPTHQSWRLARDIEEALLASDASKREHALAEALPALIATDAHAAAAIIERIEPGATRDELRTRVARLWTAADPGGAIDWASSIENPDDRKLVASDVAARLATADPAAAIEIANLFDVGRDNGTIEHIAQLWAEEHPDDASAFAAGQPPGPLRDQLLARIALVQAARE